MQSEHIERVLVTRARDLALGHMPHGVEAVAKQCAFSNSCAARHPSCHARCAARPPSSGAQERDDWSTTSRYSSDVQRSSHGAMDA